jgi:hypothetical protein
LPTPENCSFLGRSQTWLWNRTKTRLCCHGTREYLLPICPESYRSISLPILPGCRWGKQPDQLNGCATLVFGWLCSRPPENYLKNKLFQLLHTPAKSP